MRPHKKTPSCQKEFRDQDRRVLSDIASGAAGNLWRQPMITAMKRAGARVHMDGCRRLQIVFGEQVIHPRKLDLGTAEDFRYETNFGQQLRMMAQALLAHKLTPQR